MDEFQVGDFWVSPSDVLWKVAATDESESASYAVLTRAKKAKGRITLPMSATKGWERIATAEDMRRLDAQRQALNAVSRLIGELR